MRWILLKRSFDILQLTGVDISKGLANGRHLAHTKSTQQGGGCNLAAAIDLHVDCTRWAGLELEPCPTAWDHLGTIEVAPCHAVGTKQHTSTPNQLAYHHTLCPIDDKRRALRHPRVVAHVDALFLDFASRLVDKLDGGLQWCIESQVVFFRKLLCMLGLAKGIILKAQLKLLASIVFDWVELCKNFAQARLDEVLPGFFLVSQQVGYCQRGVIASKKHTRWSSCCRGRCRHVNSS